jgi:hypothetical protein
MQLRLDMAAKWPAPNYVDPETRGPAFVIVIVIFTVLVTVTLSARLYTRLCISKVFGLDDILISCAYVRTLLSPMPLVSIDTNESQVPAVAYGISSIVAFEKFQWNRHTWDVEPRLWSPGLQYGYARVTRGLGR